jgi:hypothetical protein
LFMNLQRASGFEFWNITCQFLTFCSGHICNFKAWNFSFDGLHAFAHARTRTYTFTRNSNRTYRFKRGALFPEDWFIARNTSLIKLYIFQSEHFLCGKCLTKCPYMVK